MGDWNAILNPRKIRPDGVLMGRIGVKAVQHDLVDRYRLDHPGKEMWT